MRDYAKDIAEELNITVGLGATYYCGSDSYPYYVSVLLPGGVVGLYEPDSHFENDWTDGWEKVDLFDPTKEPEFYIRKSYGHWWKCTKDGKRICRWHDISFGHASSYRDPSF